MNILEVIEKKRDKKELTKEEISFFIKGYTEGSVTDYQAAALIMAIYLNGSFMFVSGYFYTYKGKINIVNPIIR